MKPTEQLQKIGQSIWGAHAFVKSWQQLLQRIADKSTALSGKTITTEELKQ